MNRLLTVAVSLLLAGAAVAQEKIARVGYLSWQDSGPYHEIWSKGFVDGLRAEGYVEGRNLQLLRRSASNDPEKFKPLARELAAAKVDVFFASATPMATAAWYAAKDTPIVISSILDPVRQQFVESLGRPGTRVTGVLTMSNELAVKRLQLLAEVVPGLKRVGVVVDEAMRTACKQEADAIEQAAGKLGLTLVRAHVDQPEAFDTAFRTLTEAKVQAVMDTLVTTRHNLEKEFAQAALKHRLPSMSELELSAHLCGLTSYGPDFADIARRAGGYVGRILKGSRPAEMAMEQPREFRLVLNAKTARELGITFPPAVRVRADEIIE